MEKVIQDASINLIPEDLREGPKSFKELVLFICVGVLVLQFVIFGAFFVLSASNRLGIKNLEKDIGERSEKWETYTPVATSIKSIKTKVALYKSLQDKYGEMDGRLEKISSLLPQDVLLTNLALNHKGRVSLTGSSENPDDAQQLYNVLTNDEEVSSVSLNSFSKPSSKYSFILNFELNTK